MLKEPGESWQPEDLHKIGEMRRSGCSWNEIGRKFGLTRFAVSRAYERALAAGIVEQVGPHMKEEELLPPLPGRTFKVNKEEGEAVVEVATFSPVKTEKDAIRVAEVDLSIWYVHSWECRQWTVPMNVKRGQKVTSVNKVFRAKDGLYECDEEELKWRPSKSIQQQQYLVALKLRRKSPEILSIESLLEEMSKKKIVLPVYKRKPAGLVKRALEISLMDPHLGLRCFKPYADVSWSLEEAEDAFMSTTERIFQQAKVFGPFEEIVCPIGNDYFHADNLDHTTTKGTPQPEMESLYEVLDRGEKLMLWFTERLRKVAPVTLLSVPGNHDRLLAHLIARVVKAFYAGAELDDIRVDVSSSQYKFWSYGASLIGFNHGRDVSPMRLPGIMANETRLNHWQQARYCEWHLGDQHRKGSSKPSTFEEQGVSIEYLPSLTPANGWSRDHGYNWQKRGGMGFVYDYDAGPVARLQVNFDSYTGRHLGEAA